MSRKGKVSVHLGQWLSAHKQPINLASMATRPFHIRLGSFLHQVQGQLCKAQVPETELGQGIKKKRELLFPEQEAGAVPAGRKSDYCNSGFLEQ